MAYIGNAPVFPTQSVLPGNLQVTGTSLTVNGNEALVVDKATQPIEVSSSAANGSIKVDSSSRVTTPSNCYFSAVKTTQQSLSAGTWTLANLESTEYNVGSHFDTSTDRFTAPIAGYYSFVYTAYFLTGVNGYLYTALKKNGSFIQYGMGLQTNSHSNDNTLTSSLIHSLSANDYIEMWVYHGAAGSLNQGTTRTRFSGYLIG
tara:strand:+ start:348 stop:956 length:609 start_codon:yes stop_codon:yes gene_type:complete